MTARVDDIAADVAWARPAVIPASLILNYSGPAFAGLDWIHRWNRPILIGFESTTTRAYGGEAAAPADAQQLLSVLRTIPGYIEGRCGTWWCAADTPSTPAWALGPITAYGRVFTLELLDGGYHPQLELPYGNRDASRAGVDGILAAGVDADEWGVGTWGFGECGAPNCAPADSDAALVQSGNTPGPAEGTDLDWMYRPLNQFAAYGGPDSTTAPGPVDVPRGDENMELIISPTRAFTAVQGVLDIVLPNAATRSVNDIPDSAAIIFAGNPKVTITKVSEGSYDRILARCQAPVGAGGSGGGSVDVAAVAAAVAKATVDLLASRVAS